MNYARIFMKNGKPTYFCLLLPYSMRRRAFRIYRGVSRRRWQKMLKGLEL